MPADAPDPNPLRARMRALGVTRADLRRRTGLADVTILKVLSGDTGVLVRHVRTVATALWFEARVTFEPPAPAPAPPVADCRP